MLWRNNGDKMGETEIRKWCLLTVPLSIILIATTAMIFVFKTMGML